MQLVTRVPCWVPGAAGPELESQESEEQLQPPDDEADLGPALTLGVPPPHTHGSEDFLGRRVPGFAVNAQPRTPSALAGEER